MKQLLLISLALMISAISCTQKAPKTSIANEAIANADALKENGRDYLNAYDKRADSVFKSVLPIVLAESKNGRPYNPGASKPDDLIKAEIPAFPGAEGGGAFTPGGRGGKVFVVTSLADCGPGSFREAVEAGGARTVVFNVAGIIKLTSPIAIRAPYLTIAGQTAPGDGVCIAGETVNIETHDVIIRHLRIRRGELYHGNRDDALSGEVVGNVIYDHCSVSWGLDENLSAYRHMFTPEGSDKRLKLPTVNITIQNCISSEALDIYNHAFGSTIGGHNSLFARNLWACNISRNPSIGMHGDFNLVNNVIFNWWNRSVDGGDNKSLYNIINNYYKPGPITPTNQSAGWRILKVQTGRSDETKRSYGKAYVHGNVMEGNAQVTKNNWDDGVHLEGDEDKEKTLNSIKVDEPFPFGPINQIMSANESYEFVLENVGATLPKRDAVDERIIRQVKTGVIEYVEGDYSKLQNKNTRRRLPDDSYKKGIIIHPSQVGGYPQYQGKPYKDSDNDGMPDIWEKKYKKLGLDPKNPTDAVLDCNGDGYTNIEKYINGIDPMKKVDWKDLKNNADCLSMNGGLINK